MRIEEEACVEIDLETFRGKYYRKRSKKIQYVEKSEILLLLVFSLKFSINVLGYYRRRSKYFGGSCFKSCHETRKVSNKS